uniref:Uncharacterized protein n=1 Tax=Nelumbo nucifera TaxID=4432 RepID=A0A822ZGK5_NELNU|nr:TPA_asm: hypothetical protein HUJ06_001021 [Nelumbo nucifera]
MKSIVVAQIQNNVCSCKSSWALHCTAVSKHFNSLVPYVHDVYIKIDEVVTINGNKDESSYSSSHKPHSFFSNLLKYMFFNLFKPFHHLRNNNNTNKTLLPQVSQCTLDQVPMNFHHTHNLWIELPTADVEIDDRVLLKCKAEFGSTL